MDPRGASPPGSPRGRSMLDAVVRRHSRMPEARQDTEVWKQDLVFWLSQEVPRRRGAVSIDGQGTALYGRDVELAWVLVFGANVRGIPACSPLPLLPVTHARRWLLPAAARCKWAAHV
jgi:hypothetical protein